MLQTSPDISPPSLPALAALLQRSDIWTGDRLALAAATLPSGHPALDEQLPGGGWPRGGLVEIMCARCGIGELALVLPALAALTAADEWILLQAPPQRPFALAWQASGVRLARMIVVDRVDSNTRLAESDTWWAAEQILRAGSVAAVLLWLSRRVDAARLRRLQVAALTGGTLVFLLQDESRLAAPSPAPLRLRVEATIDGVLSVHLIKRRGAPLAQPVYLSFPLAGHQRGRSSRTMDSSGLANGFPDPAGSRSVTRGSATRQTLSGSVPLPAA